MTPTLALLAAVPLLFGAQQGPPTPACEAPVAPLTGPGLVWKYPTSQGLAQVALGDRGTSVLRLASSGGQELALLSSYDVDPPAPVWIAPPANVGMLGIASADEADVLLRADFTVVTYNSAYATLRKLSSSSPTPDWSYDLPLGSFPWPSIDLSSDGQTIVALLYEEGASEHLFHVFGPGSGVPVAIFGLSGLLPGLSGMDLCADGSTVAFSTAYPGNPAGRRTHVVDLASRSVIGSLAGQLPTQSSGNDALSADGGRVVTFQYVNNGTPHVLVHERTANKYAVVLDVATGFDQQPRDAALCADGSILAAAWWDSTDPSRAIVRAYDVDSGAQTMEHRPGGLFTLKNIPRAVAISADGSRFVVGTWGDGWPTSPELLVYAPDQDLPVFESYLGGSVEFVDMSPDGTRLAVARLPNGKHSNVGFNATFSELYDLGGRDLALSGKPTLGATLDVELHATGGAKAILLGSPALAPLPVHVPGVGRLALERSSLSATHLGTLPSWGVLQATLTLPSDPTLIGTQIFYQGLTVGPRKLGKDFAQVTLFP